MAIQVSGTTVIDGSRVLSNVTGLKTVGGTAILGSGDIAVGGSTSYNAVGTYAMLQNGSSSVSPGGTISGIWLAGATGSGSTTGGPLGAGTWRAMGWGRNGSYATVWIRIS